MKRSKYCIKCSQPLLLAFEKEYKKPKPEDDLISGDLYGKIDI